nr:MAG TPA: Mid2 like cell wall stress sensor [Caudoviricetes sp.]
MKSILILGKVMLWTEIVFYVGIGIITGIVGLMLLWFLINRKGK